MREPSEEARGSVWGGGRGGGSIREMKRAGRLTRRESPRRRDAGTSASFKRTGRETREAQMGGPREDEGGCAVAITD